VVAHLKTPFFIHPMETRSFKENVLESILVGTKSYQTLLGIDFKVKSPSFKERQEYA
jgi:hypothetical protein